MLAALVFLGLFILGLTALGQAPVVDVDIHKNRNLWKAQRNIAIAYDCIDDAQRNKPGNGEHAKRAQDLLRRASSELTLAAHAY